MSDEPTPFQEFARACEAGQLAEPAFLAELLDRSENAALTGDATAAAVAEACASLLRFRLVADLGVDRTVARMLVAAAFDAVGQIERRRLVDKLARLKELDRHT